MLSSFDVPIRSYTALILMMAMAPTYSSLLCFIITVSFLGTFMAFQIGSGEEFLSEAYPDMTDLYFGQRLESSYQQESSQFDRIHNISNNDNKLKEVFLGNLLKEEMSAVNIESFGGVGNGTADDTQAFLSAWQTACSMANSVFLVPEGKRYLVNPVRLSGPCHKDGRQIVQIAGKIVAPDDPEAWDPQNPRTWLIFSNVNGVIIQGGGIIDGSGQKWWAQSCKVNKTNPCKSAPTVLTIDSSSNVKIRDLTFQNSQQMHLVIGRSIGVEVTNLQVVAPGNSPNTDGIHITGSQNVLVQGCSISTGDDCVSIVSGSADIKIKDVTCGPGHGISIGSLGKDNSEAYVAGVTVDSVRLTGTTNGLRIKTWQGGRGFAHGIRFQNVMLTNVSNPIIVDQFYCDSPKQCKNESSAVRVSQVMFTKVKGTSQTTNAIKLFCSDTVPCQNVVLSNVDLRKSDGTPAEFFCHNAQGLTVGAVTPASDCLDYVDRIKPSDLCLQSYTPTSALSNLR